MKAIVHAHEKWVTNAKLVHGRCFDSSGRVIWSPASTELQGADLSMEGFSPLSGADLRCANLSGINLGNSIVIGSDMRGAFLRYAKLRGTKFVDTNLQYAMLDQAQMQNSVLANTNLSEVDLTLANLSGAFLNEVDLTKTQFWETDLWNVTFEPRGAPIIRSVASAKNLESIVYSRNPDALTQLRNDFKINGFREQERKITYAIEKRKSQQLRENCTYWPWYRLQNCIEYGGKKLLFDATCQYGMAPGRTLWIILCTFCFFATLYVIAIWSEDGGGIWAIWPADRADMVDGVNAPVRVGRDFFFPSLKGSMSPWARLVRYLSIAMGALYFSLLCTFHIGWRDLNFGNWITRMHPREYILRATGWVRLVSGIQSLICVFLLALGILTYFGRPFE